MKINILEPIGWCSGVAHAVQTLQKIITKHKKQKIYLVGWLVHNQFIMDSVQKQGVVVLDDLNKTRLELLTKIKDPQIVIVLSTHGTPQDALDYTNTHFKQFYDLTCTNLLNNFNMIRRLIKQGYRIIYYGTNGHPETQTVMSFSPYIQLIESPADAQKIKWDATKKYALVNQSTFSELLVEQVKDVLLKNNSNLHYVNTTCKAMRIRYEYIHKLKDADLLIIIGDQRSNNVKQLVDFAKHYQINTKLITSVADVEPSIFQNINNLVIASGTSIHPECTQAIIKKIKTIAK